jgi:hypothetical protein
MGFVPIRFFPLQLHCKHFSFSVPRSFLSVPRSLFSVNMIQGDGTFQSDDFPEQKFCYAQIRPDVRALNSITFISGTIFAQG